MSSKQVLALLCGLSTAGHVLAAPVETSLRPKARPGSGATVEQVATLNLRPRARPADLGLDADTKVTRVSTPNAAFDRWIKGFRGRALARGIKPRVFDAAFRNVGYNTEVIEKDRNQTEFKSQIWDYLDNAAAPPKVSEGQRALRKHQRTLRRIEQTYGIEPKVVVAVWGLESRYGTKMGTYSVIEALATLAYEGRRGAFFESQLVAALKILQSGDVRLANFSGSWAGAMGHTQFIPTSYLAYAVDFTGDGKRDIWSDNPADALASTAAYLRRFGWI